MEGISAEDTLPVRNCSATELGVVDDTDDDDTDDDGENVSDGMERCNDIDREDSKMTTHDTATTTTTNDDENDNDDGVEGMPTDQASVRNKKKGRRRTKAIGVVQIGHRTTSV